MDYWLHVHDQNGEIRAKKEEPVKKARWYQRGTDWYECSNCGLLTKQWVKMQYKYCPTCGFRIEGVKSDEERNKAN